MIARRFFDRSPRECVAAVPAILETLESRRFLSASLGGLAGGGTSGSGSAGGGTSGGGTGTTLPPVVSNGTPVPATIRTVAGRTFQGVIGGLKNVSASGLKVYASIDWGDGSNPTAATVAKLSAGRFDFTGRHAYAVGGSYTITLSAWAAPIAPPGGVVPAFVMLLSNVRSHAIVTGPAAPGSGPDGSASIAGGVLKIVGTTGADLIDVTQILPTISTGITNPAGSATGATGGAATNAGQVLVKINGHTHRFSAAGITSVTVDGLSGDDVIDLHGTNALIATPLIGGSTGVIAPLFNNGLKIKAMIHGGTGNDTLIGGDESDQLFGDSGNDALNGGNGTDTLRGGDGNDRLTSSAGRDKAYGGDGIDSAILGIKLTDVPPFPQTYPFGFIAADIEHILPPPPIGI